MSEYWIWYLRFQNMLIKYIRAEVIITIVDNTFVSSLSRRVFFTILRVPEGLALRVPLISQIRLIKY